MADDRLREPASAVQKATELLRQRLERVLKDASGVYSFDLRQRDGTSFDAKQATFGLEARLRFVSSRGEAFTLERDLGGPALLVPILSKDMMHERYWLSVSMVWDPPLGGKRDRKLIYRSSQVSIYQARYAETEYLQLVRAEWTGKRLTGKDDCEFDSESAGHPHWHVDAVSVVRGHLQKEREAQTEHQRIRDRLMREAATEREYIDFDELLKATEPSERRSPLDELDDTLSSLHLAQCAGWHACAWDGSASTTSAHAHNPRAIDQVTDWILSTVTYLKHEIEKATGY